MHGGRRMSEVLTDVRTSPEIAKRIGPSESSLPLFEDSIRFSSETAHAESWCELLPEAVTTTARHSDPARGSGGQGPADEAANASFRKQTGLSCRPVSCCNLDPRLRGDDGRQVMTSVKRAAQSPAERTHGNAPSRLPSATDKARTLRAHPPAAPSAPPSSAGRSPRPRERSRDRPSAAPS